MVPCSPAKPLVAPGQRYPGKGTFDVLDALLLEDMSMRVPVGDFQDTIVRKGWSVDCDRIQCGGNRYRW